MLAWNTASGNMASGQYGRVSLDLLSLDLLSLSLSLSLHRCRSFDFVGSLHAGLDGGQLAFESDALCTREGLMEGNNLARRASTGCADVKSTTFTFRVLGSLHLSGRNEEKNVVLCASR
jgi:hypothetical protein